MDAATALSSGPLGSLFGPPMKAATLLSSGLAIGRGAIDAATALSSGLVLGRGAIDAATALSFGPLSERRAASGFATELVAVEAPLSSTRTSVTAAAARSASRAETAAIQCARSWLRLDSVGCATWDMTTSWGADRMDGHTLAPERPVPVTKSSLLALSLRGWVSKSA